MSGLKILVPIVCATAIVISAQGLPSIVSISVCSTAGVAGPGSCSPGTFDTQQIVLGPDGFSINNSADGTSDEHSSVFSPGMLGDNPDYLFFVAAGTQANRDIGALVLSGGSGPSADGQWTFDFATADGYGAYPGGVGHVFTAPLALGLCPQVLDGNASEQDPTFDLHYAAPGSVVRLPSGRPGSLIMLYEGTNRCVGNAGGPKATFGGAYISDGVATSLDYGRTWPTYRATASFDFVDLPGNNTMTGPFAPTGARGASVCMGNDCTSTPPDFYGRYQVLSPTLSLASLMAAGNKLDSDLGGQEVSGFVDDVRPGNARYVYLLSHDRIARAQLHGEAPLTFSKWDGQAFETPGLGGADASIFPHGAFENCGALNQLRFSASIYYVEDTQQYLLTFLCNSPGNPTDGFHPGSTRGGAWFYSTSGDLSDPTQWSTPAEIAGSWNPFGADPVSGCSIYNGWYPTFMSMGGKPAHLSLTGYVFYMAGCQTGGATRQFSSRAFVITTSGSSPGPR